MKFRQKLIIIIMKVKGQLFETEYSLEVKAKDHHLDICDICTYAKSCTANCMVM